MVENITVKEQDCTQRLILCRRAHSFIHRQVGQKYVDFFLALPREIFFTMELGETLKPALYMLALSFGCNDGLESPFSPHQ